MFAPGTIVGWLPALPARRHINRFSRGVRFQEPYHCWPHLSPLNVGMQQILCSLHTVSKNHLDLLLSAVVPLVLQVGLSVAG